MRYGWSLRGTKGSFAATDIVLVMLAALLAGGCPTSGGPPIPPPEPTEDLGEAPVRLAAETMAEGISVFVRRSDRVSDDRSGVDFGVVPAGPFMEDMKFMSSRFQAVVLLSNDRTSALKLGGMRIDEVKTEEDQSPFSTCGVEYEPFKLAPGYRLEYHLCFHPTRPGRSSAVSTFTSADGSVLARVPLSGTGREIVPGESLPMGLIVPEGHYPDYHGAKAVRIEQGRLIEVISNKDVTPAEPSKRKENDCAVSITGGGEEPDPAIAALDPDGATMINTANIGIDQCVIGDECNVGQHVILDIAISCPDGTTPRPDRVRWDIGGDEIKDYVEDFAGGNLTESAMTAADLAVTPRDLYWKDTGTHSVQCAVTYAWNGAGRTANPQRSFVVERNPTDINRQMEDFYLWNHTGHALQTHFQWHPANPSMTCNSSAGAEFYLFHRRYPAVAGGFRSTFGYPGIGRWAGTLPVPAAADVNHADRAPMAAVSKPSFLTVAGGADVSNCPSARGATKLGHFQTGKQLADATEVGYHGSGHITVYGTMATFNAPKDPVFFRWHGTIDDLYTTWSGTPKEPIPSGPREVVALTLVAFVLLLLVTVRQVRRRQLGS